MNGTAGEGFATGILEVFHAGAWGTVCDGRRMPVPRPFERDDIIQREYYIGISDVRSCLAPRVLLLASGGNVVLVSMSVVGGWEGRMCTMNSTNRQVHHTTRAP